MRRYGATYANYVGKPLTYVLATPERPDDADNPLRIAFGNEASERDIEAFGRRFGCMVVDGFGSTENAVVVQRAPGTPPGCLGVPVDGVAVLDPETGGSPRTRSSAPAGELLNPEEATGELVNTQGAGAVRRLLPRRGRARPSGCATACTGAATSPTGTPTASSTSPGAPPTGCGSTGRTSRPHRSSGSCCATRRIAQAAVYAVPDESVGDQVVAALVLRAPLTPDDLSDFLAAQPDLGPKAWPRYVRVLDELPRTATNKVLKRELAAEGAVAGAGVLWTRAARGTTYA